MRWDLHGLTIEGTTNDPDVRDRWEASFASRPESIEPPAIRYQIDVVDTVPKAPTGEPVSHQGASVTYYVDGQQAVAHMPTYGQLQFDLANGTSQAHIVPTAVHTYGVFEDIIAAGLSPHLRRHRLFIMNAFAAARDGYAVLLIGNSPSDTNRTGLALLDAGWQLLSNASPILTEDGNVRSFPSLLAATPDTYARFDATDTIAQQAQMESSQNVVVTPESVWPNVWAEQATIRAFFFLRLEDRQRPAVETLRTPEALRRLVPHAVEQWDREMVPSHLRLLRRTIDLAQSYMLRLGPDVSSIPALLASAL